MKITMHMLCERLAGYEPEATIRSDRRQLQNVRLFSENLLFSNSTVYLAPLDDNRIICTNENDIMILHSDDMNEVLNDILEVFEYYNNFEDAAVRMADEGCTAEELLQHISGMTGAFMIMADTGFYMRASAGPERFIRSHSGLENMLSQHMLPYAEIEKISAEPYIRRHDVPPYLAEVTGMGTACVNNLFVESRHAGWLVCCKENNEFSEAERDRIDCAGRITEYWLQKNPDTRESSEKAGIILEFLNGENEKTPERLGTFGWMETDEKQAFVLKESGMAVISSEALMRRLEILFPDAFVFMADEKMTVLVNYALFGEKEFRSSLREVLTEYRCAAAESPVFRDMSGLKNSIRIASLTADLMRTETGEIGSFGDVRLLYITKVLEEHAVKEVAHPAVGILREYDRNHEGDLLRTLKIFLQENCSYTAAARTLFIHRSTLIYRMERIEELTHIRLSDPEERLLLQLSYYF